MQLIAEWTKSQPFFYYVLKGPWKDCVLYLVQPHCLPHCILQGLPHHLDSRTEGLYCQEQHSHSSRFDLLGELLSVGVIWECSGLRGIRICYHTIILSAELIEA